MQRLSQELEREIVETIRRVATPLTVGEVKFRVDEDWEGDEAIFIDVDFVLSSVPTDARKRQDVHGAVIEVLQSRGDRRFPYVRQHFSDTHPETAVA